MNHIRGRKHFGELLGLGALTVALVISASDRSIARSRLGRTVPQTAASAERDTAGQTRQEGRQSGPSQPRVRWWKDPAVIKELDLKPEQADRIETLWKTRERRMAPAAAEHKKQQEELNRMMAERKVGPETIGLQVDRVEAQRTALNKSWTVMIYEFSLVLTPKQNKALQDYRARTRRQGR